MQKMEYKWFVPFTILAFTLVPKLHTAAGPQKLCPLCHTNGPGQHCCKKLLQVGSAMCCSRYVSESMKGSTYRALTRTAVVYNDKGARDSPYTRTGRRYRSDSSAWSFEFWNYTSFITAASQYQSYGFGTTQLNRKFLGTMEIAALLAHVGSKVSCDTDEGAGLYKPVSCGLCYYEEKNTSLHYCDEHYKDIYPCAPGVAYYGRGALPIYWNYNYGEASKDLNVDLLNHPEYIVENATLAFLVAIWRWMTPIKENQPSAHDVFIGNWEPTENDALANRVSGFGTTMNVLYGDLVCGHGENETSMNNIINYYLHYLDLIGVGQKEAGSREVLSCAKQVAFNPSVSSSP